MEISAKVIKKYEGKTPAQLLKLAEKHFNAFIRKRDSTDTWFVCISCQKTKKMDQMNAGHYMAAGHYTAVRFNEDNVHGQCIACNQHLHGNLIDYRKNLLQKIGPELLEEIEGTCRLSVKWDRFVLIGIIETYKTKCK